jgi:hypothetical protein
MPRPRRPEESLVDDVLTSGLSADRQRVAELPARVLVLVEEQPRQPHVALSSRTPAVGLIARPERFVAARVGDSDPILAARGFSAEALCSTAAARSGADLR